MKLQNEQGFTMIEMVVVIAIGSLVMLVAAAALMQVAARSAPISDHTIAVHQLQNAGYWVSSDALKAQSVMLDDPETAEVTEFLTLRWVEDWGSGSSIRVAYTLEEVPGGLNELWRHEQLYDEQNNPVGNETLSLIAQYIESSSSCSWDSGERVLTLTIEGRVGEEFESRTYTVKPRPF